METPSIGGAKYYILFKDDASAFRTVMFIKHKSDSLDCFKEYNNLLKNKFGRTVKIFHTDNGTEFCNFEFQEYLLRQGIQHETTAPYTPEQNGRVERENRTVVESARSMLYTKDLPKCLWAEAVNTAVYILNTTPTTQIPNSTPFEIWHNKKPSMDHIRMFGSEAYTFIPKQNRTKLEPKAKRMILVGYDKDSTNYRLFDPISKKVTISRNVTFNETADIELPRRNTVLVYLENDEDQKVQQSRENQETNTQKTEEKLEKLVEDAEELENKKRVLRPRENINPPKRYEVNFVEADVPTTYTEAVNSPNSKHWKAAIVEELEALKQNDTWELVSLPPDKRCITSKWVFKIKRHPNGQIHRYRARLVARGFDQVAGIDYVETFAPTTRYDTIRVLLALAVSKNLKILQFDIKTAFLHGNLNEEVYMEVPEGVIESRNLVCRLKKALYGLKQASRCWNLKLDHFLQDLGFQQCQADRCVYVGRFENQMVLIAVYVDDGIVLAEDDKIIMRIINEIEQAFQVTVGKLEYFLGMEIKRDEENGSIFIHGTSYIDRLIKKFNMEDAKPKSIPADPNVILTYNVEKEEKDFQEENIPYREAIGSLMFAALTTRPDIMYVTNLLSRFQTNYNRNHWKALKCIIRYLKETRDFGILYNKQHDSRQLIGYSDADYANDRDTRRSTTGYVFMMCGGPITWTCQRQKSVSLSTTEAEYIAGSNASRETVWLRQLLLEIGHEQTDATTLYIDNQSTIKLIQNPVFHKRSKHIRSLIIL